MVRLSIKNLCPEWPKRRNKWGVGGFARVKRHSVVIDIELPSPPASPLEPSTSSTPITEETHPDGDDEAWWNSDDVPSTSTGYYSMEEDKQLEQGSAWDSGENVLLTALSRKLKLKRMRDGHKRPPPLSLVVIRPSFQPPCLNHPIDDLSPNATEVVMNALDEYASGDSRFGRLNVKRSDLLRLRPGRWVNDELINPYLQLVANRAKLNLDGHPKVHVMDTQFYSRFRDHDYEAVQRWTRKIDIFAHRLLIIPIHLEADKHWCLATVDFEEKRIDYLDPLFGEHGETCIQLIENYLRSEYYNKRKAAFDTRGWQAQCRMDIPSQLNGCDCGVFLCVFAEYISRLADFTFTFRDMDIFRRRIVYELCEGKLLAAP